MQDKSKLITIVATGDGDVELTVNGKTKRWHLVPASHDHPQPQKHKFVINWCGKGPRATARQAATARPAAVKAAATDPDPTVTVTTTQDPCERPPCDYDSQLDQFQQ